MKQILSLYMSFSIISLLSASPIIAAENLNLSENLSPSRMYAKAISYRNGEVEGFPKDEPQTLSKAESLFLPLAERNDLKSMHNLAMIKLKQEDFLSAYTWFSKAAAQDFAPSYRNLQRMENENVISLFQRIVVKAELNQLFQLPEALIIKGTLNTELPQNIRSQLANYVFGNTIFNFSQETLEDWGFNPFYVQTMLRNITQPSVQDSLKFALVKKIIEDQSFNKAAIIPSIAHLSTSKNIAADLRWQLASYLASELHFNAIEYPQISTKWMTDREFDSQFRRSLPELFFKFRDMVNLENYTKNFLELLRENIDDYPYAEKLIHQMSATIDFKNIDELRDILTFIRNTNTSFTSKAVIVSNLIIRNPFMVPILKDEILSILQDQRTPKRLQRELIGLLLKSSPPGLQVYLPLFLNIFSDPEREDNDAAPLEASNSIYSEPASHLLIARGLLINSVFDLKGKFEVFENFVSDNNNPYFTRAYIAAFLIINADYTITLNNLPLFTHFIFHNRSLQDVEVFILKKLATHCEKNIQDFIAHELHNRGMSLPSKDVIEEEIIHLKEIFI